MLPLLISMVRTRLELAAIDTEAHIRESLAVILALFAAAVLGLIVCVFVGITLIAIFWDTNSSRAASVNGTSLSPRRRPRCQPSRVPGGSHTGFAPRAVCCA